MSSPKNINRLFIYEITQRYRKDQVSAMASKLTFYILLSAFPFVICLLEAIRITGFNNSLMFFELTEFIPKVIMDFVIYIFTDIKSNTSSTVLPFAVILALWSASKGILTLLQSLYRAYQVEKQPKYLVFRLIAFFYTFIFILLLIIVGSLIVFGNNLYLILVKNITLPITIILHVNFIRYFISIVISLFFFIGLYTIAPLSERRFKDALPGTFFVTFGWIGVSALFSFYLNYSNSLSLLYGSLSNIIIVLLWLYICSIIMITGAEINAVLVFLRKDNINDPSP